MKAQGTRVVKRQHISQVTPKFEKQLSISVCESKVKGEINVIEGEKVNVSDMTWQLGL